MNEDYKYFGFGIRLPSEAVDAFNKIRREYKAAKTAAVEAAKHYDTGVLVPGSALLIAEKFRDLALIESEYVTQGVLLAEKIVDDLNTEDRRLSRRRIGITSTEMELEA